jgi:sugar/nucleoside kinase (ribokinase family)
MYLMKVIGVGDNVVDMYLDQGKMYLGGNALNFSNFARELGVKSSFIGNFGTDEIANYAKRALNKLNIDISHSHTLNGENGRSRVALKNHDRVFIDSNNGGVLKQGLNMTSRDIDYINQFDIVHFNINGNANQYLTNIKGPTLIYDFSDLYEINDIKRIAQYIDIACFSVGSMSDQNISKMVKEINSFGIMDILITRGSYGAYFFHDSKRYIQKPVKVTVVDTMGAGDAFITSFVIKYKETDCIEESLKFAAEYASQQVQRHGSFNNPEKIPSKYNVI